jgi:hypothetical protein
VLELDERNFWDEFSSSTSGVGAKRAGMQIIINVYMYMCGCARLGAEQKMG